MKWLRKFDEAFLMGFWRQGDERKLHVLLKNPKHNQADGKAENKNAFKAVTKMAVGRQVEKIAKIRRQTPDDGS